MSCEIHHLHLKFAFFLWLFVNGGWTFGESSDIKTFQIWWISETKRLVSTLRLSSSISSPQIRQSEAWCMTWIFIRLIKLFWPWKEKKAKARTNAKKSNNTALWETREWKTYVFWTSEFILVYQNSRLSTIPTFNMIKVNRYDNRGKISRTS